VTLYNAADVFTSPIDNCQETFGITPVEAMACGVPQVVANWDGYRDTVQDGTTGFLVPTYWYGSCDADLNPLSTFMPSGPITNGGYQGLLLAQSVVIDPWRYEAALQQLIDNPSLRERMAVASRQRAVTMFDWATIAGRYEELWTELIQVAQGLWPSWDRQRPFMNNWRLDYCRRFSGYASQILTGEESLEITEEGCRLRDGRIAFPFHAAIEQAVEPKVVDPAMVGQFLKRLGDGQMRLRDFHLDGSAASHAMASRVALWLLKHGFAKLG
jgi:hypothetical protein